MLLHFVFPLRVLRLCKLWKQSLSFVFVWFFFFFLGGGLWDIRNSIGLRVYHHWWVTDAPQFRRDSFFLSFFFFLFFFCCCCCCLFVYWLCRGWFVLFVLLLLLLPPGISSFLISTLPVHSPAFFPNLSQFFPVLTVANTGSCVSP